MPELELAGCTPEPLMGYLKALGTFRLVAEQADSATQMSWRGGVAHLHSNLDRDGLVAFFLQLYRPTPILAPWNGGSGFFDEDDSESVLGLIRRSTSRRLSNYRDALTATDTVVRPMVETRRELKELERKKKALPKGDKRYDEQIKVKKQELERRKARLQTNLRQFWPDELLPWFDSVMVLDQDCQSSYPPLLGTGGNDGRLEFTNNFMQRLGDVLPFAADRKPTDESKGLLSAALFADTLVSLGKSAIGQFNPSGIGGANGTQGRFEANSRVNPWDFVLMIEGALLFAGSVARRMGANLGGRAVFPFSVESVAVGYGSATASEETTDGSRAELWLPLWDNGCSLAEIRQLFAEGRAQLGRRQARNAVEFALADNLLGVSRGVKSFARYGFLKRNGLSFLAAPLGRVAVQLRPNARLLDDPPLSAWLEKLRAACRDKEKTPSRYQAALRGIDRAVFAFVNRSEKGNDTKYLLDVLVALGRAERILSAGLAFCKEKYLRPLQNLSPQWLAQADDGSTEFRLATALAAIRPDKPVGPLRAFLEEVEVTRFVNWSPGSTSAVWSKQSLAANLSAVFLRRQMEAFRSGHVGVPLYSPRPAPLADVIAFLNEETDDDKIHDLLWGLIAVDFPTQYLTPESGETDVPFEFGVPRLLVQESSFVPNGGYWQRSDDTESNTWPEPDVFNALASGQAKAVQQCVDRAARRLKSGGLLVTGYRNRRQAGKSLAVMSAIRPERLLFERLLAAMLFPLSQHDLERIANAVLYPPESEE
jgi:CRISPR-associated protein Csx17